MEKIGTGLGFKILPESGKYNFWHKTSNFKASPISLHLITSTVSRWGREEGPPFPLMVAFSLGTQQTAALKSTTATTDSSLLSPNSQQRYTSD